ncbi:VCBS domain-containing protein, partial [Marinomonas sp.]
MSGDRNGELNSWESIGYVKIENGIIQVQSTTGEMRQVGNNSDIFFGDIVIAQGVAGFIVFFEGNPKEVPFAEGDILEINDEIYHLDDLDFLAADSSTSTIDLQEAILAGEDPTLIQDPSAAGEEVEYSLSDHVTVTVESDHNTPLTEASRYQYDVYEYNSPNTVEYLGIHESSHSDEVDDTSSSNKNITNRSSVNSIPTADDVSISLLEDTVTVGKITAVDDSEGTINFSQNTSIIGLTVYPDGTYVFDASSYDYLAKGEVKNLTAVVSITDSEGGVGNAQINITLTGTNDAPTAQVANSYVTDKSSVQGQVHAADVDLPEGAQLEFSLDGQLEGLVLNSDGSYVFDGSSYNYLKAGETEVITASIIVKDDQGATTTVDITFTLIGTNQQAVITGNKVASITEDSDISIDGKLTVIDIDTDEASFIEQSSQSTTYGLFSISPAGDWSYTSSNGPQIQALNVGETLQETITVTTQGGDTEVVTITIHGTDDETSVIITALSLSSADIATGSVVANFSVTDVDDDVQIGFSPGTNLEGYYSISGNSVVLTQVGVDFVNVGGTLPQVSLTTSGSNNDITVTTEIDSTIGNLVDSDDTVNLLSENAANGTAVGITAFATDADGDTVTYSLSDNADGRFTIDATTGVVTVSDASKLDYETDTSHDITILATSVDGS